MDRAASSLLAQAVASAPGILSGDLRARFAEFGASDRDGVSRKLYDLAKRGILTQEKTGPGKFDPARIYPGPNIDRALSANNPPPKPPADPRAPAKDKPATSPAITVEDLLAAVGANPGITSAELGAMLDVDCKIVSARLWSIHNSCARFGKRLERVSYADGKVWGYRWYLPADLPAEVVAAREAAAARAAAEEAERIAQEQKVAETTANAAASTAPVCEEEPEALPPTEEATPAEPEPAAPTPLVEAPDLTPTVTSPTPIATPAPQMPQMELGALFEHAAAAIASQFVGRIKFHLASELLGIIPDRGPAAPPMPDIAAFLAQQSAPAEPPKVVRQKIVILGLLPIQAGSLQQQFGDFFDLRFWDSGDNSPNQQLRDWVKTADWCLIHTKHASHSWEYLVKSIPGGKDRLVRVSGGTSSVRDWLLNRMREIQAAQ